jgi:hypothetical protein
MWVGRPILSHRLLYVSLTLQNFIFSHHSSLHPTCLQHTMIRSRALRILQRPLSPLSSTHVLRPAVQRAPVLGLIQTRRFSQLPAKVCNVAPPTDAEPTENPELFDVLLTGIDSPALHGEISERLGVRYLSPIPDIPALLRPSSEVNGVTYGVHERMFFPLITSFRGRTYNIHYLFGSSSPFTYLSHEVCNFLFSNTNPVPARITVEINGLGIRASPVPASCHFKEVCILGTDFCSLHHVFQWCDYELGTAKLIFKKFALARPKVRCVLVLKTYHICSFLTDRH